MWKLNQRWNSTSTHIENTSFQRWFTETTLFQHCVPTGLLLIKTLQTVLPKLIKIVVFFYACSHSSRLFVIYLGQVLHCNLVSRNVGPHHGLNKLQIFRPVRYSQSAKIVSLQKRWPSKSGCINRITSQGELQFRIISLGNIAIHFNLQLEAYNNVSFYIDCANLHN